MSDTTKDTIYIDIDDEITSIIDKVSASPKKLVALVLPKRAAVLQSVVNMKLLKRSSEEAKKNVVLITSEAGLLPLAGTVGIHVAKTLQSKPVIPKAPEGFAGSEATISSDETDDEDDEDSSAHIDLRKSIGALAGLKPTKAEQLEAANEEEPIELDNESEDGETTGELAGAAAGLAAISKSAAKKLKVPNFEKFRSRAGLAMLGVVILLVGWIYGFIIAPHATITIKTDSTTVNSNLNVTLDVGATAVSADTLTVPATLKTYKKTNTQKVPATGQKDNGTKASGTLTVSNCSKTSNAAVTVASGTGVSAGGLTFITQKTINLDSPNFDGQGNCKTSGSHIGTVAVVAQNNGDQYNLSARSDYKVAGYPGLTAADNNGMTGGTSQIVKVVSQADIQTAQQSFNSSSDTTAATDELKKQFMAANLMSIVDSLNAGTPVVTTSPNVGDQSSDVTVTAETTYTMFGVKQDDLAKLLDADLKKQIDTSKQNLIDNGLSKANIHATDKNDKTAKLSIAAVGLAGAQLNEAQIKTQAAGKKKGTVISNLQSQPGVKDVSVKYSPFWVLSTPKSAKHIKVIIQQPDQQPSQNAGN